MTPPETTRHRARGRQQATIADVAARAGVSTSTVSRILTAQLRPLPATAAAVERAIRELDYRPDPVARALRRRATATIGMLTDNIVDPVLPGLVNAVTATAEAAGFRIVLSTSATPEQAVREINSMLAQRVDGLLIACSWPPELLGPHLGTLGIPVVFTNTEGSGVGIPQFGSDNYGGARQAAEHLLSLGHRHIAYVGGPAVSPFDATRIAGIRSVWADAGLSPAGVRVCQGTGTVAGGVAAAEELLLARDEITAVATYNDLTAIGVLNGLRATGLRVPDDISLIGYDGIAATLWTSPALTTVSQQTELMGRSALSRLLELVGDKRGPLTGEMPVRLPMVLEVRASTAPPQIA